MQTLLKTQSESQQARAAHADSKLTHMCALDIDSEPYCVRMTGIICTIGPSSDAVQTLKSMMKIGMNICRLNLAHSSYEYHALVIKNIKEAASMLELPTQVAIATDITGPGIRLGRLRMDLGSECYIEKGSQIRLTTDLHYKDEGTPSCMFVDNQQFIDHAEPGKTIVIEDEPLTLVIKERGPNYIECIAEKGGLLINRDLCNLEGFRPVHSTLSLKDQRDIKFSKEHDVNIIMVSFVSSPDDVVQVRQELGEAFSHIKIIAKIESYKGIKRFDEILKVSDGVMVARGNMGHDFPPEKVFLAQKCLIGRANKARKPVILSTQILDSMTEKPRPTRAEAGDVANAILDGADCLMLSKETAKGKYPLKALLNLCAICQEAEAAVHHQLIFGDLLKFQQEATDPTHTIAIAAVEAAFKSCAKAIIVTSASGRSAALISAYRPRCVIIAITRNPHTAKCVHLYRSVLPFLHEEERLPDWSEDVENRITRAISLGKHRGYLCTGDMVILVTGWQDGSGYINTVRLVSVPDSSRSPSPTSTV